MSALAAPMMLAGLVLSHPVRRTTPSSGYDANRLLDVHRHQVPVQHRGRLHERLAEREHRELEREPARLEHAPLDGFREAAQVHVAVDELAPAVADADDGASAEGLVGHTRGLQPRPVQEAVEVAALEPLGAAATAVASARRGRSSRRSLLSVVLRCQEGVSYDDCVSTRDFVPSARLRSWRCGGGARDEDISRTLGAGCTARSCTLIGLQIVERRAAAGRPAAARGRAHLRISPSAARCCGRRCACWPPRGSWRLGRRSAPACGRARSGTSLTPTCSAGGPRHPTTAGCTRRRRRSGWRSSRFAARLAATRATEEEASAIAEAYVAMEAGVDDQAAYLAADLRFHDRILASCHNELLGHLGRRPPRGAPDDVRAHDDAAAVAPPGAPPT